MIVSACLLGINCRYDGSNVRCTKLIKYLKGRCIIPVCPEQLAGFSTPRECCEIVGGDGFDVLNGTAKVVSRSGVDYTKKFIKGAKETLKIAKIADAKIAIFKDLSPSCGVKRIYDGTFRGRIKGGVGVTVALLKIEGINVMTPEEFLNMV